jgi:class 3 adenylate cyclase
MLTFAAFIGAVTAYNLHFRGFATAARWLLLADVVLLWLGNMAIMGPGLGLEFCFAGISTLPLLLFGKPQPWEFRLAIGVLVLVFPLGLALAHGLDNPPSAAYTAIAGNYYYVNAVFLAVVAGLVLNAYNRAADESFRLLEDQKAQTEELISRVLPAYVAEKVGTQNLVVADWHSEASVLVATVHGFENLYQRVSAVQLVEILSEVFREFDDLARELGVDKVNTLGTNYIAATGIDPARPAQHAAVARLALGMGAIVTRLSDTVQHDFSFSAGLSTGDVVSGVIGKSLPSFDIWGKTVETADALRERGATPSIVVNEAAFWRLRGDFDFEKVAEDAPRYRLRGERSSSG